MKSYLLGEDLDTKQSFYLPKSSFDTHWHLIGGTGKGKTTALHRMLREIMLDSSSKPCMIIIDRMGNLSAEMLLWMSSRFCTQQVRDRLVYVEPARQDVVLGFNPLLHDDDGQAFFRVNRAADIILRGWASQNLQEMPRLSRWLMNTFLFCSLTALTIADSIHLVMPGSPYHTQLLALLPDRLRWEWDDLIRSHASEVGRILEAVRNRLKPFYDSQSVQRMFSSTQNKLNVRRFMQNGNIVLINLWPGHDQLPTQSGDIIGGLVVNEVLSAGRSLPFGAQVPTYLVLDEFQRFVGPDLKAAIPEVRQQGIKLILSHQSFAQLKEGEVDLTDMIFTAQSRMIFGLQGEDADILAHELAHLHYDPRKIKDEVYAQRQRLVGYDKVLLNSWSAMKNEARKWNEGRTDSSGKGERVSATDFRNRVESTDRTSGSQSGQGGSSASGTSEGTAEHYLPIHETYWEMVNRTYSTFEEDAHEWGRDIRQGIRGMCFVRVVDQKESHRVFVKKSAPGHLAFSPDVIAKKFPKALEDRDALIEKNFQSDLFVSPAEIERESRERLDRVLNPRVVVPDEPADEKPNEPDPFI